MVVIFGLVWDFFCKSCYTINDLGLLTCMRIKLSASSSIEDSHTGSNFSSKDTAATFQQKTKNTSLYTLKHCTYLEFGLCLFKINYQGCNAIKYLKLNLLLVESVAVSISV